MEESSLPCLPMELNIELTFTSTESNLEGYFDILAPMEVNVGVIILPWKLVEASTTWGLDWIGVVS